MRILSFRVNTSSSLTHSSVAATFQLDNQEADENFDLAVIASLKNDVVPHLGDPRLPDEVVVKLGQTLQRGSIIYELEERFVSTQSSPTPRTSTSRKLSSISPVVESVNIDTRYPELGSSRTGKAVPREKFSYECLDLLFAVCSNEYNGLSTIRFWLYNSRLHS